MLRLPRLALATVALAALAVGTPASATRLDFEDLGLNLPIADPDSGDPELFYDGYAAYAAGAPTTDFTSDIATFWNDFNDFGGGCCWQGWAYSQTTDTASQDYDNQYSAIPGAGARGSATYGVSFTGSTVDPAIQQSISRITLSDERALIGAWFTNTTLTALSMQNGDLFADPFGGPGGAEPDFLILTITGFDAFDAATGAVDFVLADYRFEDGADDYIVDSWTWVDLSALGSAAALGFSLASSDTSGGFLNTPAYFAMDELVFAPEPGTGVLLAFGLALLAPRRRS
jgi:hypothetical protein